MFSDNTFFENTTIEKDDDVANNDYLGDFLLESKEHLENIEKNLLAFKENRNKAELIDEIFRDFHTIKSLSGFVAQELIQRISHETENVLDKCRKGNLPLTDELLSLILKSADFINSICVSQELNRDASFLTAVNAHFEKLNGLNAHVKIIRPVKSETAEPSLNSAIDRILYDTKKEYREEPYVTPETKISDNNIEKENEDEAVPVAGMKPSDNRIEADTPEINIVKTDYGRDIREDGNFARVPVDKIAELADLAGEVSISIRQLERRITETFLDVNGEIKQHLSGLSIVANDLHKLAVDMSMVSLKNVFNKLRLIGIDTIKSLNKNVELAFFGEDTKVDRHIADKLADPLLHLIKNCIYHGIEHAAERITRGKPGSGRIEVRAYNKKGDIIIEISDDGKGIDVNTVLKTAVEKSLVNPNLNYSDDEIRNFLFLPGLTTLNTVDGISGRGVGLDVVKTQITRLGGTVNIKSRPGYGTTFVMKLSANTSIINGLIVEIDDSLYILPTISVKRVFKPEPENWVLSVNGPRSLVETGGEIIPVIDIAALLKLKDYDKMDSVLVILDEFGKKKALPVNRVLDKCDIQIKPLNIESYNNFVSGGTVLNDGKVAIILDVESIFKGLGD